MKILNLVSVAVELAGIACVVVGCFFIGFVPGMIAAGAAGILLGLLTSPSEARR